MLKRIQFLLVYLISWVIFFELARIFFLFSTWQNGKGVPVSLLFQSLWYGLKMDLSMASYITSLVCLFVIAGLYIHFFNTRKLYVIYTGILLFIQLILILADTEIYKAWGTRIDYTPLKYLSTPAEMWASISHLPIFLYLLGFLFVYLIVFWLFRRVIIKSWSLLQNKDYRIPQAFVVLLFTGSLIIPIRGGLQLSPINQSSVYFCNDQYANNAAVNASWNFMFSVTQMNKLSTNPYVYMDERIAEGLVNELNTTNGRTEQVITVSDSSKPNVVLIIWESFTEKVLNKIVDGKPVINYFPQLMKEGIYFSNCYSSGDRTDKGISAVLSSYPALPKGSIVNYPDKNAKLPGLGTIFLANGYHTGFYYGGEPEFANIKSYLSAQQFQRMITKSDFNEADMNSKWGAHDDVVMRKILQEVKKMNEPYFTTWLTLSSHEPFETPVAPVFTGKDKETKFLNSLHYSDSVIYSFINELKKLPSWQNTLVIISADHGHYLPVTGKRADDYRIPVLWLGGALEKNNIVIAKTVNQLDMAASLVQQVNFSEHPFPFGKNIFDSTARSWAFFTYNDGIGFVTDSSRLLFDNAGKRVVFEEGKASKEDQQRAKAIMQVLYTDFLKK